MELSLGTCTFKISKTEQILITQKYNLYSNVCLFVYAHLHTTRQDTTTPDKKMEPSRPPHITQFSCWEMSSRVVSCGGH